MAQTKVKLIADGVIVQGNLNASHGITTADIGENASYLYYTDARVSNYLSTNGYDTATNIIASITDSAPSTLDTLNELAAALGDDANFSTTVTNSIATKLPLAGGTLTGSLTITGGTAYGLNITTSGTQETIKIDRAATNDNAITKYQTASADKWIVGLRNTGDDNFRFYSYGTSSDVLTIDQANGNATFAGDIGIGTNLPKTSLDIVKNADIWHLMVGGATKKLLVGGQAVSGDVVLQAGAASTPNNAAVTTAYNLCLQRDGGNVGIGVAPSATQTVTTQITKGLSLFGNNSTPYGFISNNHVWASGTGDTYLVSGYGASYYKQYQGIHTWATAPSGTAGGSLTFTERMRIDSSGNVGIGGTPSAFANYTNVTIKGGSSGSNLDFKNSSGTRIAAIVSNPSSDFGIETNEATPILFKTNGSEKMRIDSSGNLGVFGNTNPSCPIDFGTTVANDKRIIGTYVNGNLFTGIGMSPTTAGIRIAGDLSANNLLDIGYYSTDGNYTWSSTMFIANTSVGIGTISPDRALDVAQTALIQGTGNVNAGTLALGPRASGVGKWSSISGAHYNQSSGSGNGTGSAGIMMIGTYGAIGNNDVYIGGGLYEVNAATNIRFYTHTTDTSTAGGTQRMHIDSSGRVGIGAGPADWAVGTGGGSLRIGSNGHIQDDSNSTYYAHNLYYNAGWKFLDSNAHKANYILMADDGTMQFANTTNTGTAGQAATVVERMRIDSNGVIQLPQSGNNGYINFNSTGLELDVNRNPETGGFADANKSHARISISGANGGSSISFNTAAANNTVSTQRMSITSGGIIEVRVGATVGGELKLTGSDNDFTINGKRGQVVYEIFGTQTYVMDSQQFYPSADNARNIGTGSNRFSVVYSANGVNTSDETLKENIEECDLGINFINSLKPKSYNFKDLKKDNDAYGKKRYGLIAQDLLQTELKDSVFGKKDGEYGLSYNDLIAPMIKAIQELKAEVELLKTQING